MERWKVAKLEGWNNGMNGTGRMIDFFVEPCLRARFAFQQYRKEPRRSRREPQRVGRLKSALN